MSLRITALGEHLRSSLWFLPSVLVIGAGLLALGTVGIDRNLDPSRTDWFLFGGGADGAQSVLSTIASAMLSFTVLVFTITMVVLQLASGQFSPRLMRTFLRDRESQLTLGVFTATFVFALLVLQTTRAENTGSDAFVPALSVSMAFLLVLVSIMLFVRYAHHIARSIRVVNVIDSVTMETRDAIDRLYPEDIGTEPVAPTWQRPHADAIVEARRSGVITGVEDDGLLRLASENKVVIELKWQVGSYVPQGAPLFAVYGSRDVPSDRLAEMVQQGTERAMAQDAAFGFRQLVDLAVRALSPGTNDPTTAVQVLDRIHDLLRRLALRRIPSPLRLGEDGSPRVLLPRPDWGDYVQLACEEIRHYGSDSVQVVRRLRAVLQDLCTVVRPDRLGALEAELEALGRTSLVAEGGLEPPTSRL